MSQGLFDERQAFGDQLAVPKTSILILEQNDVVFSVQSRGSAGVLDEEQGSEAHDFRLAGKEAQQQPAQTNRFLAQRNPYMRVATASRITFVEEQVKHGRHGRESRCPLRSTGRIERNI